MDVFITRINLSGTLHRIPSFVLTPSSKMSLAIPPISPPKPFLVSFSDVDIARLHRRLEDTRLPSRLNPQDPKHKRDSGDRTFWPTPEYLAKAIEAWKKFDIRKMETELNRYVHLFSLVSNISRNSPDTLISLRISIGASLCISFTCALRKLMLSH